MSMKTISSLLLALALGFALAACEREEPKGPAERAGENIDKAIEQAGDKAEEAADKLGQAIENTGDKLEQQTEPKQ